MEAVGSRLGRASSRYGTPTVFSGPVRKWKKKWVQVSPPSSVSSHNSHSNNNSHNNNNGGSRLLLCRWTPITPPTTATADTENSSGNASDEPPRRKFRYTPIAVLEEQKKTAVRKAEYEHTSETGQSTARPTNVTREMHGKLNMNGISEEEETQESNTSHLELGLGFKGDNSDISQNVDDQLRRTSSSGLSMN